MVCQQGTILSPTRDLAPWFLVVWKCWKLKDCLQSMISLMTLAWNLLVTLAWSSLSVTGGRYEYPGGVGLYLLCYLSDGFGLWKDSEQRTKVTLR
jgi:hypothetical protein